LGLFISSIKRNYKQAHFISIFAN